MGVENEGGAEKEGEEEEWGVENGGGGAEEGEDKKKRGKKKTASFSIGSRSMNIIRIYY